MVTREVAIGNTLGMHARAAAKFVRLASSFQSRVQVARDARVMDGKSIMGLLLLSAARGTVITVSAEGPDALEAVEALCGLVHAGFEDQ